MPIYNGIEFIEESVSSVVNQTYKQWELLIGINGHEENSEVYKKVLLVKQMFPLKKISVFDFYKIKGKANTLNAMIPLCSFKYIALLDVDDVWSIKKLETQYPFILKYDVVGSKCKYFGKKEGNPNLPLKNITYFNFFRKNPIVNSSCIIRKELCVWNQDEYAEDYDLWLRLRKLGKTFYNCPEILVKHRIHVNSSFNSTGNHELFREQLLKKHLQS